MAKSVAGFHSITSVWSGSCVAVALCLSPALFAQDHGRDPDRDRLTRLEPGTVISVRTQDPINVERTDNRIFSGTVDQEVRGDNGRLAIPRGSQVELIVRIARDNDLILDLDSVMVNGQRYAISTDPNRIQSQSDNSVVGSILGAINGGEVQGRAVRLPRGSLITFRIDRPMDLGVADRGVDRGGYHYHDYYGNPSRR